eukprot:362325-Chlamydomonas_euryale.AAC.2
MCTHLHACTCTHLHAQAHAQAHAHAHGHAQAQAQAQAHAHAHAHARTPFSPCAAPPLRSQYVRGTGTGSTQRLCHRDTTPSVAAPRRQRRRRHPLRRCPKGAPHRHRRCCLPRPPTPEWSAPRAPGWPVARGTPVAACRSQRGSLSECMDRRRRACNLLSGCMHPYVHADMHVRVCACVDWFARSCAAPSCMLVCTEALVKVPHAVQPVRPPPCSLPVTQQHPLRIFQLPSHPPTDLPVTQQPPYGPSSTPATPLRIFQ